MMLMEYSPLFKKLILYYNVLILLSFTLYLHFPFLYPIISNIQFSTYFFKKKVGPSRVQHFRIFLGVWTLRVATLVILYWVVIFDLVHIWETINIVLFRASFRRGGTWLETVFINSGLFSLLMEVMHDGFSCSNIGTTCLRKWVHQ